MFFDGGLTFPPKPPYLGERTASESPMPAHAAVPNNSPLPVHLPSRPASSVAQCGDSKVFTDHGSPVTGHDTLEFLNLGLFDLLLSAVSCQLSARITPLECVVPRFRLLTPLECAVTKTRP